jgi:hypothetical protein
LTATDRQLSVTLLRNSMNTELVDDELRGALFGDSEPSTPAIKVSSANRTSWIRGPPAR